MALAPVLEVGQTVLVAPLPRDAPWRMVVDVVQDGQVTLASFQNEHLPPEWRDIEELCVTSIERLGMHLIHVPVRRVGETRVVIGEPDTTTPVQRRAYVRIYADVPARCMLLDPAANTWVPFDAEIRDLGGGGCSLVSATPAAEGTVITISLMLDDRGPLVVVGRVLPHETLPTVGRVLTRVEFMLIREADRDRVLRYILLSLAARRHGGAQP